jgi:Protein of unknown function (DUF1566)
MDKEVDMKRLWPGVMIVISFMILNGCVSVTTVETARNFIAYTNGTVLDTRTKLMWAEKDNGSDINWPDAKSYCENYRGGGYTDWRMPTQDELAGLYDAAKTYKSDCGYDVHLTEWIRLTCGATWASDTRGSDAAYFYFSSGVQALYYQSYSFGYRALPVRSGKNENFQGIDTDKIRQ